MIQEEIRYHNQLWYYKTYNQLIDKCIQMESEGYSEDMYTEIHHILPRCLGGKDDKSNLVRMPIKYHIVAHLLLSCIYPNNVGLLNAAIFMITTREGVKVSVTTSVRLRTEYSNLKKGKRLSEEQRRNMSKAHKGKILTEEHKKKISESEKGRVITKEHREKIRQANLKNRHIWTKKVQGPDGTIYDSLKDCYTSLGKSKKTLMRWIKDHPEKGYRYI